MNSSVPFTGQDDIKSAGQSAASRRKSWGLACLPRQRCLEYAPRALCAGAVCGCVGGVLRGVFGGGVSVELERGVAVPGAVFPWVAEHDGAVAGGDGGERSVWLFADAGAACAVAAGADGMRECGGGGELRSL